MILLTDLVSISYEHLKKLMDFMGDQIKWVIILLESNIEHIIVI
jgi:hypothetical protein